MTPDEKHHRAKMENVLKIFKIYKPYRLTCGICNITKIGPVLYSHALTEFICSQKCYYDFTMI